MLPLLARSSEAVPGEECRQERSRVCEHFDYGSQRIGPTMLERGEPEGTSTYRGYGCAMASPIEQPAASPDEELEALLAGASAEMAELVDAYEPLEGRYRLATASTETFTEATGTRSLPLDSVIATNSTR